MSSPVEEISSDFKLNKVLEEYVNDRFSLQLCLAWIKTNASAIEISQLVFLGSMSVLEKSKISRLRMGVLFAQLIEMKILSISNYCLGLESIFDNSDDPVIDIPKVWMSVAELISPVICDEIVSLKDLHNSFKFLKSSNSHAPELLNCLFKVIIQERSITFLKKTLKNSMLTFTDFMEKSQVNNFVKQNNIAFLHTELNISESLGSIQLFGSWNRGSNVKTQLPPDDEKETEVIDQDSISVKEDVKLHETENAWKPARFIASATMTDDEKKTEELYKKVRGVLNKLTPQKFETLLDQVRSLDIDTTERLQGVVDLVFEKAVDEPSFSVAYALLSREVALMQVPTTDATRKEEFVNFRKLLVTRCQLEFEKNSIDETERNRRIKEIEDTEDGEKLKDMQLDLDEYDRRLRMKSVGNVRFIGELFKQQMLTVNVMLRCLNNLLETKDEESLECLCTLLTTVGKALETKKVDLGGIFSAMKDIADKKHGKISNRVRFMIQDVIDLRSSRWIPRRLPRRQDLNPKTMDQIRKEVENEQLTIQAMNSGLMTLRRDKRSSGGGGGGGDGGVNSSTDKKRTRNVNDDSWSTAQSRGGSRTPFTVQSDKLKNRTPMMDEPLGSIQMFGSWGRGSNVKTQLPPHDEKETEELYKKVRGVLNKLTPQKFETLLDQVRSLDIDTTERLQGVIDLVFEKAVDEHSFSVAYALLCRELALMQVPATDAKRKEGQEFVNFRKLLVTRCQLEFEKNSIDETKRSRRIKEIEDTEDGEKKKDMQLDLDEYDRRLTMRSVGTVRFIGELFKQQMLTVNVMLRCLNNLLETKDEESLECLCTLLTTVGKALETKKVDLGGIFSAMKDIADKKHGKISNRVRFMIQDVIDLRSSRWIPRRLPRRQDLNPKTMDQIQKEAENEPLTIQAMNSGSMTPRRGERSDGGGGGGGGGGVNSSTDKKRTRNVNDDGWSTAQSRGSSRTPFTVQSDKLKNRTPMIDEPSGSIQMFGPWGRSSNVKTQLPPVTNTAIMYAALENIGTESDKRPALGLRMSNQDLTDDDCK